MGAEAEAEGVGREGVVRSEYIGWLRVPRGCLIVVVVLGCWEVKVG